VNKKQTKREMQEVVWRSEMPKSMKDDVDSKSPILYLTYRNKVHIPENCMSENEYVSSPLDPTVPTLVAMVFPAGVKPSPLGMKWPLISH
jgi:hypothetical protein